MKKQKFRLRFQDGPVNGLTLDSDWSGADEIAKSIQWQRAQLAWTYHSAFMAGKTHITVNLTKHPELLAADQKHCSVDRQHLDHTYALKSRSLITGVEIFRLVYQKGNPAIRACTKNQRRSERYAESATAIVRRLVGVDIKGTLCDVSSGGLSLELPAPLRVDEHVLIRLNNPKVRLSAAASVVHLTQTSHDGTCLVGLKFQHGISPANLAALEQWLATHTARSIA